MNELLLGFLAVMFLLFFGALIFAAGNYSAGKKKGVPNIPSFPGLPPQRYIPIIEQQYGRDLLEISTEIFLEELHPYNVEAEKQAVEKAKALLEAVYSECLALEEKRAEEFRKQEMESAEKFRADMMDCKTRTPVKK